MRGPLQALGSLVLALAVAGTVSSCAGGNYYTEVEQGRSEYVEVRCSPAGNRSGFDIEFPPCICNHGITISWFGNETAGDDELSGVVVRRGYLSDMVPEVLMSSPDGKRVDRVMVRDDDMRWQALDRGEHSDEWRRNEDLFVVIMESYGPKLYEFEMYCKAMQAMKRGASGRGSF
jgi:hypothetical protein